MPTTFRIRPQNLERLRRRFATAPGALYGSIHDAMRKSGHEWERAMRDRTRGQTRPDGLGRRTGALARSISSKTTGTPPKLNSIESRMVSAGVPYAPIHEFGGVIKPKRAKNLTIPIADNLTAAGDVRYPSARALFQSGSDGKKPFVFRAKNGGAFIGLDDGSGGMKLLWKLAKSVTIQARLGFFKSWKDLAAQRRRLLRRALVAGLRGRGAA